MASTSSSSHLSDITDSYNVVATTSRVASASASATVPSPSLSNEMKSSISSRELAVPASASSNRTARPAGRENPALRRSSSEQTFEHPAAAARARSPHTSLDSRTSRPQVQAPYNPYNALHAQQQQQQHAQYAGPSAQSQPWAAMPVPMNAFYPYPPQAYHQAAAWSAWQHEAMMNMHANGFVPQLQAPQHAAHAAPSPPFLQHHLPSSNSSTASAASFPSANDDSSAATTQSNASAGRKNFHPYRREPSRSSSRESPRQVTNAPLVAFPQGATVDGAGAPSDDDDQPLRAPVRPFVKARRSESLPEKVEEPQQRARQDSADGESLRGEQPTVTAAVRAVVAPAIPVTPAEPPASRDPAPNAVAPPVSPPAPRIPPGHHRQTSSTSSMGVTIPSTLGQSSSLGGDLTQEPPKLAAATAPRLPSHVSDAPTPRSVSDQPKASEKKATGLKGRLQRALKKDESKSTASPSPVAAPRPPVSNDAIRDSPSAPAANGGLGARRPSNASFAPSMTEPVGGNSGKAKRNLFSMKNASTDNISISSTVSSASMMIRKMGALGKLARRNSIAGISKIFKDKSKDDDDLPPGGGDTKKKDKKLRFGKSAPATSTTSHATAETLDEDKPIAGLSPAAQLARQHTLRQKAEEQEEAAKQQQEELAQAQQFGDVASDVDSIDEFADEFGEVSLERRSIDTEDTHYEEGHWGTSYRDRHAVPARGILKKATSFSVDPPTAPWTRARANSTELAAQPGPLDKVSKATHVDLDPFSPSFSPFESSLDREPLADRLNFPYGHPNMNTSAPVLSLQPDRIKAHRSATTPAKKALNWAPECAIYHTFHATEYDRRSEPATCNRLTPQLAQQIKDELNGYKMEEMPVHPSSRIHTHFL